MRVLAISHSAVAGPYRKKWRLLSKRKGWKLLLALPERWPEGGAMLEAAQAPFPGLAQRVLGLRLAGRVGFFSYRGLAGLVREFRPELVYCEEEPYSLAAWQAAAAAKSAGAAFVFFSWENLPRTFKPPLNWVRRRVQAMSRAGIVGSSESLRLYRHWGFEGPMAQIPQYGVDCQAFKPKKAAKRAFKAAYLGRLAPEKGVDLFVRACAAEKIEGLVVGRGPEEAALKALASVLKARIEFRAFVPFEERQNLFREFDALVLPSRGTKKWKEQFGRVLIEAMASGLPCVGSSSGAIPEVIGKAGLIFKENDQAGLGLCLRRLARDARLRARLGRLGRKRALSQYSEARLASELGRFLEKVGKRAR